MKCPSCGREPEQYTAALASTPAPEAVPVAWPTVDQITEVINSECFTVDGGCDAYVDGANVAAERIAALYAALGDARAQEADAGSYSPDLVESVLKADADKPEWTGADVMTYLNSPVPPAAGLALDREDTSAVRAAVEKHCRIDTRWRIDDLHMADFVADLKAALSRLAAAGDVAAENERLTPDEAWHELVEKDDRNSPEDYPEMCLITVEELRDFMQRAALTSTKPGT